MRVAHLLTMVLLTVLGTGCAATISKEGNGRTQSMPAITDSYVMFYYTELSAPASFYENVVGLKPTFTDEWVKIYRLTDTSYLGIVREGKGAYHKARAGNAVMLSIVTNDIDAWYEKIAAAEEVSILKHLYNSDDAPIRAFLVADPSGYTVEFFQWRKE